MNRTILLTGATGLVGRFVLAELLCNNAAVAVLVRGDAQASARQRLEAVLSRFETCNLLPRPKVITGDLCEPLLGITKEDIRWLEARELDVVHCAASIRFVHDEKSGEPYQTNVSGTTNLLALIEKQRVENFHHVSTAYVGARAGTESIIETSIDDVGLGGNDYERSKIQAESLVRSSRAFGKAYIHRPSIVVGESQTGFSSTFHGFYAPLQAGAQFAQTFGFTSGAGRWFREQLGLNANDSKNLVPVDWLAKCISHVVLKADMAPQKTEEPLVCHWTNPRPAHALVMQEAITDAIQERYAPSEETDTPTEDSELSVPDSFRGQLSVYESYFSGDPIFENSNAACAAPHLTCPETNYEMLRKMADFAIETNFGWPKHALPPEGDGRVREALGFPVLTEGVAEWTLEVQLLGPDSPEKSFFTLVGGDWHSVSTRSHENVLLQLPLSAFTECLTGKTALGDLIDRGRAIVQATMKDSGASIISKWLNDVTAILASQA